MIHNLVCGGGGSGGGLNFAVRGYASVDAMPASTKENTLAIITAAEMNGYAFDAVPPESPADGVVWIGTDTSGDVTFNALKKNGLQIYPNLCKQYVSGGWVRLEAYIFQNGEWVQFSVAWDGTLYDNGNQYEDITGGWLNSTNDDYLANSVWSQANYSPTVRTANKIDLTGFATLHVTYSAAEVAVAFGVTEFEEVTSAQNHWAASKQSISSQGTYSVDVSSLNGEYYIALVAGTAYNQDCGFRAIKVWLE